MADSPPWVPRALSYLVGITLVLLVVQYLLGLWTNAYAPAMFSPSNHSFAALGFHVLVGYVVGVVALALLIVAAFSRNPRYAIQSFVVLVAIALAGVFGMLFVSSTPNNPAYSFGMGFMFLVAFGACMGLSWSVWGARSRLSTPPSPSPPSGPTT
ncbi:MAG: hypothetical protein WA688_02930 [Thermoplasmata archaeon]